MRVLVAALALGFVPTLVFSWVYELTPEGLNRENEVDRSRSNTDVTARRLDIAVIALLVVVGGLLIKYKGSKLAIPFACPPAQAGR